MSPYSVQLLTDENIPAPSVRKLRALGFDVVSVQEEAPGIADPDVIALAQELGRPLLTLDSDFGERIFHRGDTPPPGILFLRGVPPHPEAVAEIVEQVLADGIESLDGLFVTVHDGRVRRRAFPV